jgi:hypothetical protein
MKEFKLLPFIALLVGFAALAHAGFIHSRAVVQLSFSKKEGGGK